MNRKIIINRIPRFQEWKLIVEYLEDHPDDGDAVEVVSAFENKFHVEQNLIREVLQRVGKAFLEKP